MFLMRWSVMLILSGENSFKIAFEDISRDKPVGVWIFAPS